MITIAVVIVAYNRAESVGAILDDLAGQTRRPDEIIVVDNASRDNTAAAVKASPIHVRYVRNDANLGSAGGYREGIRLAAEHDYVWCLDDDVMFGPDTLGMLVGALADAGPAETLGALQSVSRVSHETRPRPIGAFGWRGTLIPTAVIGSVGLPDDRYFLYGEDYEYSLRIARAGYRILCVPRSLVIERSPPPQRSIVFWGRTIFFYEDPSRLYYAFRNELYIHRIYGRMGRFLRALFRAAVISCGLYASREGRDRERAGAVCRGVAHSLQGRLGKDGRYDI